MIETANATNLIILANPTKMTKLGNPTKMINTKRKGTFTAFIQNDHKNSELPLSLADLMLSADKILLTFRFSLII